MLNSVDLCSNMNRYVLIQQEEFDTPPMIKVQAALVRRWTVTSPRDIEGALRVRRRLSLPKQGTLMLTFRPSGCHWERDIYQVIS